MTITASTDGYSGTTSTGLAATFTHMAGTVSTPIPILMILDSDGMKRTFREVKYTPQSGTLAGLEQVKPGSEESTKSSASVVYEKAHHAALDAIAGVEGTLVWTLPDGATLTGTGFVQAVEEEPWTDSKERRSKINFSINLSNFCRVFRFTSFK